LNITSSDFSRAQEHFQLAVDNHHKAVIEPTEASANDTDGRGDRPEAPSLPEPFEPVGVANLENDDHNVDDDADVVAEVQTQVATADIWGDATDTSHSSNTDEEVAGDVVDEEVAQEDNIVGLAAGDEESDAEPADAVTTPMQDDGADVDAGDDEILDVPELVEETVDALPDRPEAWTRGSAHADVLHTLAPPPPPPADTWSVEDEVASTDVWSSDNPASDAPDLDAPAEAWGADTQPSTNGWGADDDAPVAADSNWATSDTEETVAAWGSDDEVPSLPADNGDSDDATTSSWGADDDQATTWSDDAAESPEEETTTSWGSSSSTDPWATEPLTATATTDEVAASADSTGSFFSESTATATDIDIDDDPRAAMVREAVDRVTDGDGAN